MGFIPLHVYSGYSFLQSGLNLEKYVKALKKGSFLGSGLSDFELLTGLPHFDKILKRNGLKPLLGLDLEIDELVFSIYLLNEIGYQNLLQILFLKRKDQLTLENLNKYSRGLVFVLAIDQHKLREPYSSESDMARFLLPYSFLGEYFYLGIDYLIKESDRSYLDYFRNFAIKYNYQTIAFPFIKYVEKKDALILTIVKAIKNEENLNIYEEEGNNYLLSNNEITSFYTKEEIAQTAYVHNLGSFELSKKRGQLLKFNNLDKARSDAYLKEVALLGLQKINKDKDERYLKQLDYELDVIQKMGYSDYFLIVSDFVNFAKQEKIAVGPGRGSAASSLVSYVLNIVTCDPLENDLLFERFLNPERLSLPDIDIDFSDVRRHEVIQYLKTKYGHNKVANIMTVQTIGAKQALRDIGRVYQIENREIDYISKLITDPNVSLRENYKKNRAFRDLIKSDDYYLKIVTLASYIEGLPRQHGMHAAGIILNDRPLEEVLPVSFDGDFNYLTEFEMDFLEEQGFLKIDLLGLRNLSIIDDCLSLIKKTKNITLNYENLPYDDLSAIKLISKGQTMGLFQLESRGMKKAIQQLKPEVFNDIVALLALFRPGPMDNIPIYASRKKRKTHINYPSPTLEKILSPTYGIIVYQEQIMQIVREMARFSYSDADLFRRAISKKDSQELANLKQSFISQTVANNYSLDEATKVFNLIYKFADYGFNKSHSLCYAKLATQMAYLKVHYPLEFYVSILSHSPGASDEKFTETLSEIKNRNIKILNPNINYSQSQFTLKDNALLFPLSIIKGFLSTMTLNIIKERQRRGPFLDFFDFVERMYFYKITPTALLKLINAGAFDLFKISRANLRASINKALQFASLRYNKDGQLIIEDLGLPKPLYETNAIDDQLENLQLEYETLGLMLSGTPLKYKKDLLKKYKDLVTIYELTITNKRNIHLACVVRNVNVVRTKRGQQMAFVSVYDESGELEVVVFSRQFTLYQGLLEKNNLLRIKGTLDDKGDLNLIANEIYRLED